MDIGKFTKMCPCARTVTLIQLDNMETWRHRSQNFLVLIPKLIVLKKHFWKYSDVNLPICSIGRNRPIQKLENWYRIPLTKTDIKLNLFQLGNSVSYLCKIIWFICKKNGAHVHLCSAFSLEKSSPLRCIPRYSHPRPHTEHSSRPLWPHWISHPWPRPCIMTTVHHDPWPRPHPDTMQLFTARSRRNT